MLLSNHARSRRVVRGLLGAAAAVALGAFAKPLVLASGAQGARLYETSDLSRRHNRALSERHPEANRLLNGVEYGRGVLYETLWAAPGAPVSRIETTEFRRLTNNVLRRPPRLRPALAAVQPGYARVAPRVEAILEWARMFSRQLYDVWADESIAAAEKDGYVLELLEHYRSRPDLAISSSPKRMALLDGRLYSLSFRQKYPRFNGLFWAFAWLEQGLYESLLTGADAAQRRSQVDAVVRRFWQMMDNAPETTPYLIPRMVAVAPTFANRYPEVGAILDNMHVLQNLVADILVSTEIPRAAKGREIDLLAGLIRSDTAESMAYDEWLQLDQRMGLENMGGPAVGFTAALAKPTVVRGAPMVEVGESTSRDRPGGGMPGMDHGAMAAPQDTGQAARLNAIHQRMLADPVIRERVATDPVLQRLLAEAGIPMAPGAAVPAPAMDHTNMPGMQQRDVEARAADSETIMGIGGADASAAARRRAIEFVVRLLSDPAVAGRIHADPELHRLWSDPDVQRRLAELQRMQAPPNERGAILKPKPPPESQVQERFS